MEFVIRFLILTLITVFAVSVSTEGWAKHNIWLMIGFVLLAGLIFMV